MGLAQRLTAGIVLLATAAWVAAQEPVVQPVTRPLAGTPASQAASQPTSAEAPNPLRSPQRMMEVFRAALRDADENPGRLADAQSCLDFSNVDKEVVHEHGSDYARHLGEMLDYLIAADFFNPATLPDNPAAETQVIGKDPLLLVIERHDSRIWQFSPTTVADIPRLYETWRAAGEHATTVASEPTTGSEPAEQGVADGLRSPRALVTHFLVALSEAQSDPEQYAEALACMNFSGLGAEVVQEQGPHYAEKLGDILQMFLDDGVLQLEALPDNPDADAQTIGRDPVLLILTREPDDRWQFAARTVAQIPAIHALRHKGAEAAAPGTPSPTVKPAASGAAASVPAEFRSPRATMDTFLRAMGDDDLNTAVRCLDLTGWSASEREANAWVLAGKLLLVLRRHDVVVLQKIPDEPDAESPYKHLVNRFGRIEIGRHVGEGRDERAGEWLFTPGTVRSIERLYEAWETRPLHTGYQGNLGISFVTLPSLWLRERIIPPELKIAAFGWQYWQWLGILIVLLAGRIVQWLANRVLPWIARRILPARGAAAGFEVDPKLLRPFALLGLVLTWGIGLELLDLGAKIVRYVAPALWLGAIMVGAWAVCATIDLVSDYSAARAAHRETRLNDVLVPLVRKTLKVIVVALAGTTILGVLGFQIGPLLAGLGIGGLAFSFAAKDTLANFFGSVNVVLDRPFQVGDWVKIGPHEGKIESVGLRSSRLRTFHDSQLTVPNSEIMNAVIDNMGRRRYRRTLCTLHLTYGATPEQLEAFCEGIRELIRLHPHTRKDEYRVHVRGLGPSVEVLLSCFHEAADWGAELREQHRLYVDILRLARRLGIEFAYPAPGHVRPEDQTSAVPADLHDALEFGRAQAKGLAGVRPGKE